MFLVAGGKQVLKQLVCNHYDESVKKPTDVFLDIYIELGSYKGKEYLYEPYVPGRTDELFKKFRQCLQYNTRSDVSCQLARVHYFDIRFNNIEEDNMEDNKIDILWIVKKMQYIILNGGECVSSLKTKRVMKFIKKTL
jgi:hypothetical protein